MNKRTWHYYEGKESPTVKGQLRNDRIRQHIERTDHAYKEAIRDVEERIAHALGIIHNL
jgi:hypothetical protein